MPELDLDCSDSGRWRSLSVRHRCRLIAGVSAAIAEAAEELTRLSTTDQRTDPVESITSELFPLCSAIRFVGRHGPKILRPRRCGAIGRPLWLPGVHSRIHRQPHGRVLILGTWNYSLFLPGVQTAQALAAGNQVLLKPAPGCEALTERMVQSFYQAGIPTDQLRQLDSSTAAAVEAIDHGVDLIVLTGSASTGRTVLAHAAKTLTPTIMELSGCDAAIVMPGAPIDRAADAIAFGMTLNSGATCIGPRRLIATDSDADALRDALQSRLATSPSYSIHPSAQGSVVDAIEQAIGSGAIDTLGHFDADRSRVDGSIRPILLDRVQPEHEIANTDLFAPIASIIRVDRIDEAEQVVNSCPYRLAASVYGPRASALSLAHRLDVGSVTVNDLIVPTADPRVPFGGRGDSGYGVTRGREGLLAMTVPKVISQRTGCVLPHLKPRGGSDESNLLAALHLLYARRWSKRLAGLRNIFRGRESGP